MHSLLSLLLGLGSPALAAREAPPGPVSLLVCDGPVACAEDAEWAKAAGAHGGLPLIAVDTLLELDAGGWVDGADQRARFQEALEAARAAASKGQWGKVLSEVETAQDALRRWTGRVSRDDLFLLSFLEGTAALHRNKDERWQAAFRQAASIRDGQPPEGWPLQDEVARRAFLEELRKLAVGGRGDLALTGLPDGARLYIDGNPAPTRSGAIPLLPGTHRVTVEIPGAVRSWKGDVPVLAERTSAVRVEPDATAQAAWVQQQLVAGFDALALPRSVAELLGDWCLKEGHPAVRLVRVEPTRRLVRAPPVGLTSPPPTRPEAAEGERVDMGDGVPATFSDHVVARYQGDRDGHVQDGPVRLRVAWFEPATGRILQDPPAAAPLPAEEPPSTRAGLHLGYARALGNPHAMAELTVVTEAGPVWLDVRAGLARGSEPYLLYPGWTDRQLYHLAALARWRPDWTVRPYASLGPELYLPVSVGGRGAVGVEGPVGMGLMANLEGHWGLHDTGQTWGLGAALTQGF